MRTLYGYSECQIPEAELEVEAMEYYQQQAEEHYSSL